MLDNTKQNRFDSFFHAEEYLKMYLEADDQSNEDILVNSIVVRFVDGFTIDPAIYRFFAELLRRRGYSPTIVESEVDSIVYVAVGDLNPDYAYNMMTARILHGWLSFYFSPIRTSCRYCRSNWRILYQRISISLHIIFFR